jgi:hypothetical protein
MHLSRAVFVDWKGREGVLGNVAFVKQRPRIAQVRGNYTEVSGTRLLYVSVCVCANSVFFFFSQKNVERTVGDIRSVRTGLSVDTQVYMSRSAGSRSEFVCSEGGLVDVHVD